MSLLAQTRKVVDQKGNGDFTTVQAAINAVPDNNANELIIFIKKGTYKECITIPKSKSFIRFIGEKAEDTKLTFDNYNSKKDSTGKEFGTTGSSSIFVNGDNIVFENITFENSSGPVGQAVAVNVTGNKVAFRNCRFLGFQDTLYTKGANSLQYYKDCYIEGTVDFIFGAATAVFEHCILHNKLNGGAVTAASTPEGNKYGYVLIDCTLTSNSPPGSVILGRPWRPFAKTVFIRCKMGEHIKPEGWNNWGKSENELTAYYAEYKSTGKGGDGSKRFSWSHQLTDEEAKQYSVKNILGDWNPFLNVDAPDLQADNMLLFQRSSGGWPKQFKQKAFDYNVEFSASEKADIAEEAKKDDATIDNMATTKEIRFLVKAYKITNNKHYLEAAENGIRYLLKAQYKNGGWPQFYPDRSLYRAQVTFNDNAMINTLKILQDVVLKQNDLEVVDSRYLEPAAKAVSKGIGCIIKTQISVDGKLTAWCQQYDETSLKPAKARAYELPSISSSESVGIIEFLMNQPNPSMDLKNAIIASTSWLKLVKIVGYKVVDEPAPGTPKGKDKKLVEDNTSTIWARYYEIGTNKPFFCDRDGIIKYSIQEIGYERRNGYAWYGTWPKNLLEKKYPEWLQKNGQ